MSAIIEICDRLKTDHEQRSSEIPSDFSSDLENRWHQTWIDSVEIQCKLEERLKSFQVGYSFFSRLSNYYGFTRLPLSPSLIISMYLNPFEKDIRFAKEETSTEISNIVICN